MHNPVILLTVPIVAIPVVVAITVIVDDAIASVEGQPRPVGPPPCHPVDRQSTALRAVKGGDSRWLQSMAAADKGVQRQRRRTAMAAVGNNGDSGRRWPGMMINFIGGGGEQWEYYLTLYCSFI